MNPKFDPEINKPNTAPMKDKGMVIKIINGRLNELNCATRRMIMRPITKGTLAESESCASLDSVITPSYLIILLGG